MNGTQQPCRERLLARLLESDPQPKMYPIHPPPEGYELVCVWEVGPNDFLVGSLSEFEECASSYQTSPKCLYLTVPVAVAEEALRKG